MAMAGYVEFRWLFGRSEIGLSRAGVKKARELGLAGYVQKKEEAYRSPVAAGLGALALAGCSVLAPGASVAPASVEAYVPTPIATGKVAQISTKTSGAYWSYCQDDCPRPTQKTLAVSAAPTVVQAPAVAEQRVQKLQLAADVLFAFDSFQLTPKGRAELDRLAATLNGSSGSKTASIVVVGYADRLGSETYNRRLSEQRAQAVKEYLGPIANAKSILSQGLGRSDPVTGKTCDSVREIRKLRECLQPDRRVEITVSTEG